MKWNRPDFAWLEIVLGTESGYVSQKMDSDETWRPPKARLGTARRSFGAAAA